jgi:hypothetical protein
MARGFLGRAISDAVSRHTIQRRRVEPELAEFDARVYSQTWAIHGHPARTSFSVIGLDAAHALELGRLRLASMGASAAEAAEAVPLENVDFGFEFDRVEPLLQCEPEAEREQRRATWKARQ